MNCVLAFFISSKLGGYPHHTLASLYAPLQKKQVKNPTPLKDIVWHMKKYPGKTLLLSSEKFSSIENVQTLKDDLQTLNMSPKIIIYLRRQDYWLESKYNQRAKNNKVAFFDFDYNWFTFLQKWEPVFGKENLIIKVYEKQQMPQGLVADFLQILGITQIDTFEVPPLKRNTSLNLDLLEFKRILNTIDYPL